MGKKRSESALLPKRTLADPRRPRRPFIAGLFHVASSDFVFSGSRDEGHRPSRFEARPHTRSRLRRGETREGSGGHIKWLSTSYSTGGSACSPPQWAPALVAPLSEAPWATRICPVIYHSVQSSGGHRGGGGGGGRRGEGDSGGRTPGGHQQRQDGWLTERKNPPSTPLVPHPPVNEERQTRRIKKR